MKFLLSTTQAFFYLSFASSVLGDELPPCAFLDGGCGDEIDPNDPYYRCQELGICDEPAPAPIDPCRNNNCNNAGECTVVDGAAVCVCENTFVHNANRDGCICPEGTTLNAGSNRCFAPPTSSPSEVDSTVTGPPTLLSTLAPTASPSFRIMSLCDFDDSARDFCIEPISVTPGSSLRARPCSSSQNQLFVQTGSASLALHSNENLCLTWAGRNLFLTHCDNIGNSSIVFDESRNVFIAGPSGQELVLGLGEDNLFNSFQLYGTDELEVACTAFDIIPDPNVPVVPDDDECQDNSLFEFMLEMTGSIVGCEWLTANTNRADIRESKYCDRADVQGACQSSCDNCQCGDEDNFTFNLPNTNEVVNCAYINQNPNRIIQRRNTLCYTDSDCREASTIGESCAAACGFCDGTSTTFCTRTDPPSPFPTMGPTKSPTLSSLCPPSSPVSKGYGGSPTQGGSAPSKGYGGSAPSKGSCGQSFPSKGYASPSKGSSPVPTPSMHRARGRRMKSSTV
ncbi:predicted protein [Chaetoceros tenuissimus]|uniref:EGF-like domain-containing protein n=2 Tax=Chaetoceros tenuissimus TaxID=426638 RepID=A0AAD3CDL8_9STRA|nr:predicted protein [Chaetoceros tenuissimus]